MSGPEEQRQQESASDESGLPPAFPLTNLEAERAREDALQRAGDTSQGAITSGTRGRVEEETRRLTEQLTREEQARRRAIADLTVQRTDVAPARTGRLPTERKVRHILAPLDGSVFSERALPYAEAFARLMGADVTLAYLTDRKELAQLASVDIARAASDPVVRSLERARGRVASAGVSARTRIAYAREPTAGILGLESELNADAIVIATHARQGVDRALLGSVADDVVRAGRSLALIVPPLAPDLRDRDVAFTRILVPLDGSTLAEQALGLLIPLARPRSVDAGPRRITLLYVAEDPSQEADGAAYLHEIQTALERDAGAQGRVFTKVVLGSAPGAIVAEASGAHSPIPDVARYDLILMATHGRGGLSRWFYGSVATYALTHSETPVLLARVQAAG